MKLRLPHLVALALVLAVTVPLARAADQPTRFNGDIGRRASQPLAPAAAFSRQERLSQIQLAHAGYVSSYRRPEALLASRSSTCGSTVVGGSFS